MEVIRKEGILLGTKISVAGIQHFPDSRHKGNSDLCLSPRFVHHSVGRQILDA